MFFSQPLQLRSELSFYSFMLSGCRDIILQLCITFYIFHIFFFKVLEVELHNNGDIVLQETMHLLRRLQRRMGRCWMLQAKDSASSFIYFCLLCFCACCPSHVLQSPEQFSAESCNISEPKRKFSAESCDISEPKRKFSGDISEANCL